jgi:hypothetical protein
MNVVENCISMPIRSYNTDQLYKLNSISKVTYFVIETYLSRSQIDFEFLLSKTAIAL